MPIGGGLHGRDRISPEEVTTLLHRAKIYIDFGPHPGMDRLPREAAIANCIVITNRSGAARYEEDVPIPSIYKVGPKFDVDEIHKLLKESLESYADKGKGCKLEVFRGYRDWIAGQKERMMVCVQRLVEVVGEDRKRIGDSLSSSAVAMVP